MPPATALRHKSIPFAALELKADKPGSFRARIATLNVVDKDGDVTLAGAFPDGKAIVISAYGHTSWYGALPVGKGVVSSDDKEAWVDGEFFSTGPGKDTYETVKQLAEAGLGEWSYGYQVMKSSTDKADLDDYPGAFQILKEVDVYEASPVLVGAGVDTTTQSIKSAKRETAKARRVAGKKAATVDPELLVQIVQIDFLTDQLDELVDDVMDRLGIVDPDEPEEDAEEAAETQPKNLTIAGHSEFSLAAVQGFLQRVKARAQMRTKDGRVLSTANRERLSSLADGLTAALSEIQTLLEETDPNGGKAADDSDMQLFDEFQRNVALTTAIGL